jgi:hypothetical protein
MLQQEEGVSEQKKCKEVSAENDDHQEKEQVDYQERPEPAVREQQVMVCGHQTRLH